MVHLHLHDVFVLGDRPVRPIRAIRRVVHRVLAAQPFEIGIPSVREIELWVADVEFVERPRIRIGAEVVIDMGIHRIASQCRLAGQSIWQSVSGPSGSRTTRPSSSSRILIWHERRELGSAAAANPSMLASCDSGSGSPISVEPFGIDIDVTGRAGALAAAIGVDARHGIIDRAAHHRETDRNLHLMLGPVVFDVGNLRHWFSRCCSLRRLCRP